MSGIGHNGGPSMEPGYGFRKVAWKKARRRALPSLPLEIVRVRVARAKRLGLPYRTYATIRATSGHDIVAFLFSGNALGLARRAPCRLSNRARGSTRWRRGGAAGGGLCAAPPRAVLRGAPCLDAAVAAPTILTTWGEAGARLRGFVRERGLPPDGVVLVSATALERDWCGAAGLAGKPERRGVFRPPAEPPPPFHRRGDGLSAPSTDARKVPR
jgi:hypothetical protein